MPYDIRLTAAQVLRIADWIDHPTDTPVLLLENAVDHTVVITQGDDQLTISTDGQEV